MTAKKNPKRSLNTWLSILTIAIGVALLIMMIVVEDEPGAIPLLLIIVGSGWYFATRYRARSRPE